MLFLHEHESVDTKPCNVLDDTTSHWKMRSAGVSSEYKREQE